VDVTQGASGGAPAPLAGDWVLTHDPATGRFSRRFTFTLAPGGLADGIRWQPGTSLTLSVPEFDYDALDTEPPEGVALTSRGSTGVQLTFPRAARTLRRLKISGAQAADVIRAHRVDGDVVTEDPFASEAHGATGALLNVTDQRLVVRQKRGGTDIPLEASDVRAVIVRSMATNVRVGVTLQAMGDEVFYLAPDAGAVLTSPATASDLGPALVGLLQRVSDRFTDALAGEAWPALVPLVLVIEADVPARASITGFVLRYRLSRRRFGDGAPKRVLDVGGEPLAARPFTIEVPRGSALWSATLRMMGPFKERDGDDGEAEVEPGGGPPPPPRVASDLGVALRQGEAVAARVTLAEAALVQAAIVELTALAEASAGRLRLARDDRGRPGEALGEGGLMPPPAGARGIVRVQFDGATIVGAGPVWVVLQCDSGALLWLTAAPDAATGGSVVLRRDAGDVAWAAVGAAADRGALVSLVVAAGADRAGAVAGHPAFQGVRLHLEGVRLRGTRGTPGSAGEKETRFDIAPAIAPLVQSAPAGTLVAVSLSLVASERARVTIYPPEFEFDP
jgi:hypothetical protein